jgi:isochorismate pyruvate lyase
MRKPQDCATMAELRAEIDRLDGEIVAQLVARAAFIDRAIVLKQGENLPARIETRVEDVVTKVQARAAAQGLDPALAEDLWRRIIDWSITREEQVLGPDRP